MSHLRLVLVLLVLLYLSGCTLFLPTYPALFYYGRLENAHGYGDVGIGGNVYRTHDASFTFNPRVRRIGGDDDTSIYLVKSGMSLLDVDAGVGIVFRIPSNYPQNLTTYATNDDSLEAWLIRQSPRTWPVHEPGPIVDPTVLFSSPQQEFDEAYAMAGLIRIRFQGQKIGRLEFRLLTVLPMPKHEYWLAGREAKTHLDLRRSPDGRMLREDSEAWAKLRRGAHQAESQPASLTGQFKTVRAIDYGNMP